MRLLTLQTLIDNGACQSQVDLFRTRFGESVEVTPELCASVAADFDWDWAAENLLSARALAVFNAATASVGRVAYSAAMGPAWYAYKAAMAPAWSVHDAATAAAWYAYKAAMATAWYAFNAARAAAWANAFIGDAPALTGGMP